MIFFNLQEANILQQQWRHLFVVHQSAMWRPSGITTNPIINGLFFATTFSMLIFWSFLYLLLKDTHTHTHEHTQFFSYCTMFVYVCVCVCVCVCDETWRSRLVVLTIVEINFSSRRAKLFRIAKQKAREESCSKTREAEYLWIFSVKFRKKLNLLYNEAGYV